VLSLLATYATAGSPPDKALLQMQASVSNAIEVDQIDNKKIDKLTSLDNQALSDNIMSKAEQKHANSEV
jgi:hypothetical protein